MYSLLQIEFVETFLLSYKSKWYSFHKKLIQMHFGIALNLQLKDCEFRILREVEYIEDYDFWLFYFCEIN